MIAGTASGVGKTTISLALLAAVKRRGLVVQPFKGGPDFLDTGHHTRTAGRPARNLDTWMLSREANMDVLREAAHGANAVLVEGMMGLFDGKSGSGETASSAEIAKLLQLPVILVLDAAKSARSAAAVVLGFELFDLELPLAGVILNRVGGDRHYKMLEDAITARCKTPLLGWLPKDADIAIPERHLGLHTAEESANPAETEQFINTLAALAEQHLDIDRILGLHCGSNLSASAPIKAARSAATVRIGVARDRAFCFYYEDNLDLLRRAGAEVVEFSPLRDTTLPEDLAALYLGGGYPELYADQLSRNAAMLAAIREFAVSGRPIYAECGGMIYISDQLTTAEGEIHSMAGVLPLSVAMTSRLVRFGYVTVEVTEDCLIGAKGTTVRGHSFHYSRIVNSARVKTSYHVHYSLSGDTEREGYSTGNVLGSYVHLHFRAHPDIANRLVHAALAWRTAQVVTA